MNNPKKYNIPEDTPDMVSENLGVATASRNILQAYPLHMDSADGSNDDMEIEPLQYSLEELSDRISDGIEQYHQGIYYTQEEAHAILDRWVCEA